MANCDVLIEMVLKYFLRYYQARILYVVSTVYVYSIMKLKLVQDFTLYNRTLKMGVYSKLEILHQFVKLKLENTDLLKI